MANTIRVQGHGIREEALAAVITKPGHLVLLYTDGKVKPHNVAAGVCEAAFAVEDDLQGKTITDNYAVGSLVQYEIMERGAYVYALLENGQSVAKGAFLESAGNGELQAVTAADQASNLDVTFPGNAVAVAMEAVDMSDSSLADPDTARILVRIL